jgi:hypothetical protein
MTKVLRRVSKDLNDQEYAESLLGHQELSGIREFAKGVLELQERAVKQLESLTENLGLSTVEIPDDRTLTEEDHKYLKHLVHLQTLKRALWSTLQTYQDEARPMKESISRGGSSRRLGTTKLAALNKALKTKGAHVATAVSKFNSVIVQLQELHKPGFIPEGLVPRQLQASQLLHLEPDDPVWDEVFGGSPWIQNWSDPMPGAQIPEYAKSKNVREGILAALTLERAREEEFRLNLEKINGLNEWVSSIFKVWECRNRWSSSPIAHRLDLALQMTLRARPRMEDYECYNRCSPLIALPVTDVMNMLESRHPSELLYENSGMRNINELNAAHISDNMIFSTPECSKFDNLLVFAEGEEDIDDIYESGGQSGLDIIEEADDIDELQAEQAYNDIYNEVSQIVLQEGDEEQPPSSTSASTTMIPSARALIQSVDGVQLHAPILGNISRTLPSVRVLLDVVDNTIDPLEESAKRIVGSAVNASIHMPVQRVAIGNGSRFFGNHEISPEMLKSIDINGRHLDETLLGICGKLIEKSIDTSPLNIASLKTWKQQSTVLNILWRDYGKEDLLRQLRNLKVMYILIHIPDKPYDV